MKLMGICLANFLGVAGGSSSLKIKEVPGRDGRQGTKRLRESYMKKGNSSGVKMMRFCPAVPAIIGLLAFVGTVTANASDSASFDELYVNPKLAIKTTRARKSGNSAAKEKAERRISTQSLEQEPRLVVMKDLLEDVPFEDRAEFLNQLMFKNGQLVSANLAPLKRTLSEYRIGKILNAFASRRRDAKRTISVNSATPPHYARLSELLADVPMNAKSQFLDSLTFKDGVVVSAYVGDLKTAVSAAKLKRILGSLYAPNSKSSEFALSVCGDGWCDDSACTSSSSDRQWRCKSKKNWTCDTNCGS